MEIDSSHHFLKFVDVHVISSSTLFAGVFSM